MMLDYQKQRVLTLLDPDSDPLGAGYNIIQSKIAIGSGGLFGKGWTNGSQAHLEFLPERHTDFIFAVLGEEFGLLGVLFLLVMYLSSSLAAACTSPYRHQGTYARLLAGSISLTFLVYVFVNTAMVTGLVAGRRRAFAAGQFRRHVDGDADGRIRYSDVDSLPPEVVVTLMILTRYRRRCDLPHFLLASIE